MRIRLFARGRWGIGGDLDRRGQGVGGDRFCRYYARNAVYGSSRFGLGLADLVGDWWRGGLLTVW